MTSTTQQPPTPPGPPPGPPSSAPGTAPTTVSGLEWLGPVSFTRRYASRRVDQDLGTDWGPRHDQRLTHRHEPGADSGLLYVYDPTWGEYAVLAEDVSLHAVQQAIAQAAGTDPLPPVSAVADFLRAQQHQTTRHVTPDVVAAGPGAQVQL